jgi:hypothetical protein
MLEFRKIKPERVFPEFVEDLSQLAFARFMAVI